MKKKIVRKVAYAFTYAAVILFLHVIAPVFKPYFTALGELPVGINLFWRDWPFFWFFIIFLMFFVLVYQILLHLIDKIIK